VQVLGNDTDASAEHGIYVSNSADDPVIRGNRVHGSVAGAIQINGDCNTTGSGFIDDDGMISGAIVEGNYVFDNQSKGLSMISAPGVRIANNLIVDNGSVNGAGGIHLVNEPGCDPGQSTSNAVVVNNTVVEPRISAVRVNEDALGATIFNNLLVSPRGGVVWDADGSGCATTPTDTAKPQCDTNLVLTSAGTLFAGADDFQLAAGSAGAAAVDHGKASFNGRVAPATDFTGAARPKGAGIDLGAYESF